MTRRHLIAIGIVLGVAGLIIVPLLPSKGVAARNSGGTYSLPTGNPVVSGTSISTAWANSTLSDIAGEITNSLDRSGRGGMLAPLALPNGTSTQPAVSFTSERNSGIYRAGTNDIRQQINGATVQQWAENASTFTGALTCNAVSPSVAAITGNGNAAGDGLRGVGGGVSGNGVSGSGNGTGSGVVGFGGATGANGVTGTGGASSGNGVGGIGGTPNGTGLFGVGTGTGNGVRGVGGTTSGIGGNFSGGTPNGTAITALGSGSGQGLTVTGGSSSTSGATFTSGSSTNGHGISTTGAGTGNGIFAVGGASAGNGVFGTGGASSGIGVNGLGGATNGTGVSGTGSGTGNGVYGAGGGSSGTGVSGLGGASNGIGVYGVGTGSGAGGKFNPGTTGGAAVIASNGQLVFSPAVNDASSVGFTNTLSPKNTIKAWGHYTNTGSSSVTVNDGFNITMASSASDYVTVTFATALADSNYAVTLGHDSASTTLMYVDTRSTGGFRIHHAWSSGSPNCNTDANHCLGNFIVMGTQ